MRRTAAILGFAALAAVQASGASASGPRAPSSLGSGDVSVELNAVTIARLPPGANAIVLASPAVAAVQTGVAGELLITGRTPGATPFLLQDAEGRIVGEGMIRVGIPAANVLVTTPEGTVTYSCRPLCFQEIAPAQPGAPRATP